MTTKTALAAKKPAAKKPTFKLDTPKPAAVTARLLVDSELEKSKLADETKAIDLWSLAKKFYNASPDKTGQIAELRLEVQKRINEGVDPKRMKTTRNYLADFEALVKVSPTDDIPVDMGVTALKDKISVANNGLTAKQKKAEKTATAEKEAQARIADATASAVAEATKGLVKPMVPAELAVGALMQIAHAVLHELAIRNELEELATLQKHITKSMTGIKKARMEGIKALEQEAA